MKPWKVRARISEENCRFALPIIRIMRTMGLFPIAVHGDKFGFYLQLSFVHLIYSVVLGLFTIISASIGLIQDLVSANGVSIRIRTRTDGFVELFDWGIVYVMAGVGFFLVPSKFLTFFKYVKCIEKIDSVLLTKHTKSEKYKETLTCLLTLSTMTTQVVLDFITYVVLAPEDISTFMIFTRYGASYLGCVIMMVTEYEFQYMGSSLRKRIRKLNDLLRSFGSFGSKQQHREVQPKNRFRKAEDGITCRISNADLNLFRAGPATRRIPVKENIWWTAEIKVRLLKKEGLKKKLHGERIGKLMEVYLDLCDALGYQNEILGLAGACAITASFFHLIEASYFLLSDLTQTEYIWYIMQLSWLFIHVVRFIVVIEPYYALSGEIETTKALVCRLHYSRPGRYISRQLRAFTLILGLRSTTFSLAGAGVIDRGLYTSILKYATTYLMILLQYNATGEI